MAARVRYVFLVGLAFAAAWTACGVADDSGPGLQVGERWQQAREVVGHQKHVIEHHVACSACHDLSGKEIDRPTAMSCLGECHAAEAKIEHAHESARRLLGPDAPSDCLQCHAFVTDSHQSDAIEPWDCLRCHAEPQGDTPAVVIHQQSTCDSCHQPHGEAQVQPAACNDCHDDISTQHASQNKTAAAVCTTCHEHQHGEAKEARATCRSCHLEEKPIVPATALFEGHTECTGCHRPHEYAASQAISCRQCHEDTTVLGGGRVAAHANCASCHDAHDVKGAITKACVSCHTKRVTQHPAPKQGEVCSTCHDPHPPSSQKSPARACSNCHHAAASDEDFHAKNCKDCHQPHQFVVLAAAGAAPGTEHNGLCKTCHATPVAAAAKTHAKCNNCHGGLPHRPTTRDNCATSACHATVAAVVPAKHKPCASCHEPHGGKVLATCASCHGTTVQQAPPGHRACQSCHESHEVSQVKTCASCHQRVTPHAKVKGGCTTCHSAHASKGVTFAASCDSCHAVAKLPALHTVNQHQSCASCHKAHGPAFANERQGCTTKCHLDMQNHQPQATRCTSCHLFR